ncbi:MULTISPECIES: hypothetical protein [unclassified Mesorhizobium]|uniref:hypothetical protein n=1 Tax=unclassified Mesorhizobium TaxID=325217 RepID=UPI002416DA4E|nr:MULTISPECIES: hypothetical protein [unclassified Mesorhizobium]MDG4903499.1 hypothetical protein [Mesorhizobium sp. WSM4962]MDG4921451.1 hypothetical protein [Mesorhizobium sp. WSM4989]
MQTEFLMPFAEDGHAEGDPPSQAEIAFDDAIDRCLFSFWKCTLPEVDITFELPLTLEGLRKFKPAFQLDAERRDKLIRSIADAAAAAVRRLPPTYNPGMIVVCMSAATIVVQHWAEDDQERAAHHPHRIQDARMYVKMLERDLHNLCDYAWLQQRKAQRQREKVRSLLKWAADAGAEQVAA